MMLPGPIQKLISALERLPGVGPKSASRLAFFLLRAPDEVSEELSQALSGHHRQVGPGARAVRGTELDQSIVGRGCGERFVTYDFEGQGCPARLDE